MSRGGTEPLQSPARGALRPLAASVAVVLGAGAFPREGAAATRTIRGRGGSTNGRFVRLRTPLSAYRGALRASGPGVPGSSLRLAHLLAGAILGPVELDPIAAMGAIGGSLDQRSGCVALQAELGGNVT